MPFYEYQCRACGTLTEVLQKVSDPPLRKCPKCGKSQLQKLVSAPVFRLKGGGWYETDFKGDKDNKRNLVGADKDEAAAKPAEEAKPADKPAEKKTEGSEAAPKGDKGDKGDKASTTASKRPVAKAKAKVKRPAARKGRK
jgi:putative FmdB family regulatory protein